MVNFSSPCLTWCLWHGISPAFFHVMGIVDWAREGPSPKQHMECPLDGHKQMYVHVHRQTDADILTHQHAPLPGHGELLHTAVGQSETEERNKIPIPLRRESVLLVGCRPSYTVYSLIKNTPWLRSSAKGDKLLLCTIPAKKPSLTLSFWSEDTAGGPCPSTPKNPESFLDFCDIAFGYNPLS